MDDKRGEIAIQTLAMPADTNPNGDIFGGWLVSQMDLAAGVLAKKIARGRVVTVAIHSMMERKTILGGEDDNSRSHIVELGTGHPRIFPRTNLHLRELLGFKLVWSDNTGVWHNTLSINAHKLLRNVQFPIVSKHRVAQIDHFGQFHQHVVNSVEQVGGSDITREYMRECTQLVGLESLKDLCEFFSPESRPLDRRKARMIGKMHTIDGADLASQELERKCRTLIANTSRNHM